MTGPHDAAAVRALAERGELGADDEISRDARTWRRLRDVRGFPTRAPVDAPQSPAPSDDPITLAEVAAPVWAVLRRAGAAAARAAGSAARTAAGAAASSAASVGKSMRDAADARRTATIVWRSDPFKLAEPIRTPLGGRVSVVEIQLAITYTIRDGDIVALSVRHATPAECGSAFNTVATRRGEAFACHLELDAEAGARLYAAACSDDMRRKMLGTWRARFGDARLSPRAGGSRTPD